MSNKRPIPDDFIEMQKVLKTTFNLCKHYKATHRKVRAWLNEVGIDNSPRKSGSAPDDFLKNREGMTIPELADHYGVSRHVIGKWVRELGLPRKIAPPQPVSQKSMRGPSPIMNNRRKLPNAVVTPLKNDTALDRAVIALRRIGPVSPCDENGKYQVPGTHYRVGNRIMDHEAILAKASRYV